MNPVKLATDISRLYQYLSRIDAEVGYIRAELAGREDSESLKAEIGNIFDDLDSTIYDVRKEVRTLEDKLGMHPDEEPFDPNVRNPDPRGNIGLIQDWLKGDIDKLKVLVSSVDKQSEQDPDIIVVSLLVTGVTTNILTAFSNLNAALKSISDELPPVRRYADKQGGDRIGRNWLMRFWITITNQKADSE